MNPYHIDSLWERLHPIPTLPLEDIHGLLAPVFGPGLSIHSVVAIQKNSISNFNYRIQLDGMPQPVLLRLYSHCKSCSLEHYLFQLLKNDFKVPQSYYFGRYGATPYSILSWVEGMPLTEAFPRLSEKQLTLLGSEIGYFLAKLHQQKDPETQALLSAHSKPKHYFDDFINYLDIEAAGANLSPALSQALRQCMTIHQKMIKSLNEEVHMIHGDLKIQNILCHPTITHQIAAVLDWESACLGSRYVDLGHLFRGPLPKAFEDSFLSQYQVDSSPLPRDWLMRAKLCDILSLMSYLNTHIPMPNTFKSVQRLMTGALAYLMPVQPTK